MNLAACQAVILLGSNIHPELNIPRALAILKEYVRLLTVSTTWETAPVDTSGPNFYNAAALVETPHSADALVNIILRPIEDRLGRVRTADKNAPRTIDLDVVIYAGEVLEPRLWTHSFIAVPVGEVCPGLAHPTTGIAIASLARAFLEAETLIPHPELKPPE